MGGLVADPRGVPQCCLSSASHTAGSQGRRDTPAALGCLSSQNARALYLCLVQAYANELSEAPFRSGSRQNN